VVPARGAASRAGRSAAGTSNEHPHPRTAGHRRVRRPAQPRRHASQRGYDRPRPDGVRSTATRSKPGRSRHRRPPRRAGQLNSVVPNNDQSNGADVRRATLARASRPPLFDHLGTIGLFDGHRGACFSSDCFGAPMPDAHLAGSDDVREVPQDQLVLDNCSGRASTAPGCTSSIARSTSPGWIRCASWTWRSFSVLTCRPWSAACRNS
jgi:hypothetical protein